MWVQFLVQKTKIPHASGQLSPWAASKTQCRQINKCKKQEIKKWKHTCICCKKLRGSVTKDEREEQNLGRLAHIADTRHETPSFLHCPCLLTARNSGFLQPLSLQGTAVSDGQGQGLQLTLHNREAGRELHIWPNWPPELGKDSTFHNIHKVWEFCKENVDLNLR